MKRLLLLSTFFIPTIALALSIEPANFYTDVRSSSPEAAGINLLSREGVVQGYGAQKFLPSRQINRAEFLKIAMKTKSPELSYSPATCFPDARSTDWFSPFVCAAKDQRIISGKTFPARFGTEPYFDGSATVTYGEALKMLTLLFGYSVTPIDAAHWAEPYYRAAAAKNVDLPITINLDTPLTRGLSARLAAAFLAESEGQLEKLRLAESGHYDTGTASSSSSRSSSSSSRSSSVSSSSLPTDPLSSTEIRSQFLLLGEVGPILGAGKIFIQEEPVIVTEILVSLTAETPTVQSFLVYDDDRRLLGRATLDPSASTNRTYKALLASSVLRVAQRDERRIYVRAEMKSRNSGGQSNQVVQISSIVIKGNGEWSSHPYSVATAVTEAFPQFLTARSMFTSIVNAGPASDTIQSGARTLGSFTFSGRSTDASAHLDVTDLTFDIGQTGGVTVSNPTIGSNGSPDRFTCTVASTQIVCTAIPDLYGSVTDGPRTLTIYGTVAISDPTHASLRLTLNDLGSSTTAGAISWSDGAADFGWVSLPVTAIEGTYFKY